MKPMLALILLVTYAYTVVYKKRGTPVTNILLLLLILVFGAL